MRTQPDEHELNRIFTLDELRSQVQRRMMGNEGLSSLREISDLCRLDSSMQTIKQKVEKHPLLSLMICRAAATMECGGRVPTSVLHALEILGHKGIGSVCFSAMLRNVEGEQENCTTDLRQIAHHCIAMGVFMRVMARNRVGIDPELAFTAGLFCDIGYLAFGRFMPKVLDKMVVAVGRTEGMSMVECERGLLGYDHAQAGSMIAEELGLSELVVSAVAGHLEPSFCEADVVEITDLAHMASWSLDKLKIPVIHGIPEQPLDPFILRRMNFNLQCLQTIIGDARAEIAALSDS